MTTDDDPETALREAGRPVPRAFERWEALGLLASGYAHDINNVLALVNGLSEELAAELPEGSAGREKARELRRAVLSGLGLGRALLSLGRAPREPAWLDLGSLLRGLETMLLCLVGRGIEVDIRCPEPLPRLLLDEAEVTSIVMNLAANAREAMPGGGRLVLETSPEPGPAGGARLTVTDTGCGMDLSTQARIFEPYFTTKAGAGRGLGLSNVKALVDRRGGRIWVESAPGRGSRFTLLFGESKVPRVGVEPTTPGFSDRCSTTELPRQ